MQAQVGILELEIHVVEKILRKKNKGKTTFEN